MRRRIILFVLLGFVLNTIYLLSTDNPHVAPYRNIAQYYVLRQISALQPPTDPKYGTLQGVVRSTWGQPITDATVLLSLVDGTVFTVQSDAEGRYAVDAPAGSYTPVAGAPGFEARSLHTLLGISIDAGRTTPLDITLAPRQPRQIAPPRRLQIGAPQAWSIGKPLPATAIRREISFTIGGRSNQLTFLYTPNDGADTLLPTLLAVYPGPADTWESVSLPLAQAGYAVIAVGPTYALDLEPDIDDLLRLIQLAKVGQLPRADGTRIGALGGSYSGLHVLRLIVRSPKALDAALLLGAPTDIFELRRQFEAGTFFPPFGLDQVSIAFGLPNQVPEAYWRYSARYHAHEIETPVMLIHSKDDEVVPFTQSQLLADKLARLGKPHKLHLLEGVSHYLFTTERTPAIDDLFLTTTGFFNEQLARGENDEQ